MDKSKTTSIPDALFEGCYLEGGVDIDHTPAGEVVVPYDAKMLEDLESCFKHVDDYFPKELKRNMIGTSEF